MGRLLLVVSSIAFASLGPASVFSQESVPIDTANGTGAQPDASSPATPSGSAEGWSESIEKQILAAATTRVPGISNVRIGTPSSEQVLIDFWRAIEEAVVSRVTKSVRVELLGRLVDSAARVIAGPEPTPALLDQARASIERARKAVTEIRNVNLLEQIKCKCEKEDWTRTLKGCFENCANPQKELILEWLALGYSDDEIKQGMVEATGTTEVLVRERGFVEKYGAYAVFGGAVAAGLVLLFFSLRSSPGEVSGVERSKLDPRWEAELDKELQAADDDE